MCLVLQQSQQPVNAIGDWHFVVDLRDAYQLSMHVNLERCFAVVQHQESETLERVLIMIIMRVQISALMLIQCYEG